MANDQEGFVLAGTIIDEQTEVTLDDLSVFCSVRRERIVALVEEGVIEPKSGGSKEWRFAGTASVARPRPFACNRIWRLILPRSPSFSIYWSRSIR